MSEGKLDAPAAMSYSFTYDWTLLYAWEYLCDFVAMHKTTARAGSNPSYGKSSLRDSIFSDINSAAARQT